AVGQESPVNVPVPVFTKPGLLHTPLRSPNAWPAWSSATHLVAAAQEIATSPPAGSVTARLHPAGGGDDSTLPLVSAASQAEGGGQETAVMTASARRPCTGIGAVHPGWAEVTDGAGDVVPVLAAGVALTLATGGASGAVSRAAGWRGGGGGGAGGGPPAAAPRGGAGA